MNTTDLTVPEPQLHAIVLAAGPSRRFGSPKQLVRVQGRPLLHTAVARASEVVGQSVIVVLGAGAATLAPLLRHSSGVVVINRHWERGIASSLRAGLKALPGSSDAVLILLIDQPAVTAMDLRRLIAAWRRQPGAACAAQFGGTVGTPLIVPRAFFAGLRALTGDEAPADFLRRHPDRVMRVPMDSAALDLDTPEDLLQIRDITS